MKNFNEIVKSFKVKATGNNNNFIIGRKTIHKNDALSPEEYGLITCFRCYKTFVMLASNHSGIQDNNCRRIFANDNIIIGTFGNEKLNYNGETKKVENFLEKCIENDNSNICEFINLFEKIIHKNMLNHSKYHFVIYNILTDSLYKVEFDSQRLTKIELLESDYYIGGNGYYVNKFEEKIIEKLPESAFEFENADVAFQRVNSLLTEIHNEQENILKYDPINDSYDVITYNFGEMKRFIQE